MIIGDKKKPFVIHDGNGIALLVDSRGLLATLTCTWQCWKLYVITQTNKTKIVHFNSDRVDGCVAIVVCLLATCNFQTNSTPEQAGNRDIQNTN